MCVLHKYSVPNTFAVTYSLIKLHVSVLYTLDYQEAIHIFNLNRV